MKTLYLYKSGILKQQDHSLVLVAKDEERLFPIEQIDTIFCFGVITVNTRLIEFLNKRKIVIMFFNYFGNCTGRYLPAVRKKGTLLIKQAEARSNEAKRLTVAKSIQTGAFKNMLNLVKYYNKKGVPLKDIINTMESIKDEISKQKSAES